MLCPPSLRSSTAPFPVGTPKGSTEDHASTPTEAVGRLRTHRPAAGILTCVPRTQACKRPQSHCGEGVVRSGTR